MSKLERLKQSYDNRRRSKAERRDACKLTIKKGNRTNHTTTNTANVHNQSPKDIRMDALKTYLIKDEPETVTN